MVRFTIWKKVSGLFEFQCIAVSTDFGFHWENHSSLSKIKRLVTFKLRLSSEYRESKAPNKAIIDPPVLLVFNDWFRNKADWQELIK